MYKARWKKRTLNFVRPAGTSRGVLNQKDTWYLILHKENSPDIAGIGECSPIGGLSIDDLDSIEDVLDDVCSGISGYAGGELTRLDDFPCIQFGIETALQDAQTDRDGILYSSPFTDGTKGIPINGLIWMGDVSFMEEQIEQKLAVGNSCLKLKIGALNFDEEIGVLNALRSRFSKDSLEIRVDANGAFDKESALHKLEQLAKLDIHSIEQPIRQGDWQAMYSLCRNTPLPIALDEELIGIKSEEKADLLNTIQPQYIILKPSLLGGFTKSQEWIDLADNNNIGWWATSALESNVGLNAIAQWIAAMGVKQPQGLGTGQIYTNNIPSPLYMDRSELAYRADEPWDYTTIAL